MNWSQEFYGRPKPPLWGFRFIKSRPELTPQQRAQVYALKRRFDAGSASTLRKTARLFRLEARALA